MTHHDGDHDHDHEPQPADATARHHRSPADDTLTPSNHPESEPPPPPSPSPPDPRASSLVLAEVEHPSRAQLAVMSDERLMVRYYAGDEDAFEVLVERHTPKLKHHACIMLHAEDSDDAVQETWISVYESRVKNHFDETRARFRTWIHCILHRKALRIIARNQHFLAVDSLNKPLVSYEEIADHDLFHNFAELASESPLTGAQGAVVDALLAGKSVAQIAADEGCTESAIRRRLARAIKKMLRRPA